MKILHLCLANYFVDEFNYQENALSKQNKLDGNEVFIVASTKTIVNKNYSGFINPGKYINKDGITVTRLPYKNIPFKTKINAHVGVETILRDIKPDVIFFHGVNSIDLLKVVSYKRQQPSVKIYLDNHASFRQAGYRKKIGSITRQLLHKTLFKLIVQKSLPYIEKVFYVSIECGEFLKEMYSIPEEKIEFYPLGGYIVEPQERLDIRERVRNSLGIANNALVYLHTGRLSKYKRTIDVLDAFFQNDDPNSRLLIAGKIIEEIEKEVFSKIRKDSRVMFLGWKQTNELHDLMCAADVYIQPGNQSASLQNAICCGCAIIVAPDESHKPFLKDNGYYVVTVDDIVTCFKDINNEPDKIKKMNEASYEVARDLLDYKKLAARLYE